MKKIIHVVNINDYWPELTQYTFPTIEAFAKKIGGEVNYITKRRWPDWSVLYEKMQVYYDGMGADWNILLDADILVHPDCPDFTTPGPYHFVRPWECGFKDNFHASNQYHLNKYFVRDGRNMGISGCAMAIPKSCHDLWRPYQEDDPNIEPKDIGMLTEFSRECPDEYCISQNFARYGLKFTALTTPEDYDKLYHVGAYGRTKETILEMTKQWIRRNM